ncbi:alpha/beta hydrolase, partial [Brucella melitensis]|uniref:alpha/beta hydrolase n=1 Tax=Brucella melitensis TaxID=29459 RepID=UPI001AA0934B
MEPQLALEHVRSFRFEDPRQWLHDDPSALLVEQDDWHYPVLSDWMHMLEATLAENPGAVL